MSDWEQYVDPAAEAMWESFRPGVWPRGDGVLEPIPAWADCAEEERESCRGEVRAALAVVGPLIAEDARERLVEAAARRVQADPPVDVRAQIVADLRYLATARKDYCNRCPEHQGDMMQMTPTEVGVHDGHATASWLADIIAGANDAKGWLPSWRWDEWEARP